MTIVAGDTSPAENSCSRTRKPRLLAIDSGSVSIPNAPRFRPSTGAVAARRNPPERTKLSSGRFITMRVIRLQNLPRFRRFLPINGSRSESIRSPTTLNIAGSRVSAASMAITATKIAPSPTLKNTDSGTTSIPTSARTTVIPEKNTACEAVVPAFVMASFVAKPAARSSR